MEPMKRCQWPIVAVVLGFGLSFSEGQSPEPRTYSKQDYANAVQVMQRSVEGQLDRVQTVQLKLKATDEQIERRVSRIVDYLSTVADSQGSGTKILHAKEELLQGLKKTTDVYMGEREKRFAALCRVSTHAAKLGLINDLTRLNDRLEKRMQQVLAITLSLPEGKDVPQVRQTYYGDVVTTEINPEYTHNKTVMAVTAQIRQRVKQGLQASVERLQRSNRDLERNLDYPKSEGEAQVIREFVQKNREFSEKRSDDIMRVLTESKPATRELASRAADELLRQVQAERVEARKDANEWMRLKNELDVERAKLRDYEERLSRYQQVLDRWEEQPAAEAVPATDVLF